MAAAYTVMAAWLVAFIAVIVGLVMNVIALINALSLGFVGNETEIVARAIGVPVAILGALFGYFW